jgi:hypothetical protein
VSRCAIVAVCALGATLLGGCTPDDGAGSLQGPRTPVATSSSTPESSAVPAKPAGPDLADIAGLLPEGPATGEVTVNWSGLGQLTGPFSGSCTRTDGVTTVVGQSRTAALTFRFSSTGSTLDVQDEGMQSSSELAEGDYRVEDATLVAEAELLGGGASAGSLSARISCG